MANPMLGEVEVKILDRTLTLRPTFGGIVEMEQKAGCTLPAMLNRFITGSVSLTDIVAVVWCGLVGAVDKNGALPRYEDLGEQVMVHGWLKLVGPCGQVVGAAYSGKPIAQIATKTAEENAKKKIQSQHEPEQES